MIALGLLLLAAPSLTAASASIETSITPPTSTMNAFQCDHEIKKDHFLCILSGNGTRKQNNKILDLLVSIGEQWKPWLDFLKWNRHSRLYSTKRIKGAVIALRKASIENVISNDTAERIIAVLKHASELIEGRHSKEAKDLSLNEFSDLI